jgi:hypothetical protein
MKKVLNLAILFSLLAMPSMASAGFLDKLSCVKGGLNCSLDEVATSFVLLTKFLISAIGVAALLYFIWGGVQLLTSYGNMERIKRGQQIMWHTMFAMVITFSSFLLVEFFINDILNADDQVVAMCGTEPIHKQCNEHEKNYVCTGHQFPIEQDAYNGLCVPKCQLQNWLEEDTWLCLDKSIAEDVVGDGKFDGCSNPNDLCVNANKLPKTNSLNIDINITEYVGCCVNGIQSCITKESEVACHNLDPNAAWFNVSCDEVGMCQDGYHADPGCCLGIQDGNVVECLEIEIGVCAWDDGITAEFYADTTCPPEPPCL